MPPKTSDEDDIPDLEEGFNGQLVGEHSPNDPPEDDDDPGEDAGDDLDEGDEDEGGEGDEDAGGDDDSAAAEPPRRKSLKERFRELTRSKRELEEALFAKDMALLERDRTPPAPARDDPLPPKPDPTKFKYGEVDSDYIEALAEYRAEIKVRERRKEIEQTAAQGEADKENARYAKLVEKVMAEGEKRWPGKFAEKANRIKFGAEVARAILDSEKPVDILHHMMNNLSELQDLIRSTPEERARKLGRLEGRISAASAARKHVTDAPSTPGASRTQRPRDKDESRYGPRDLDAFEKAFYNRR